MLRGPTLGGVFRRWLFLIIALVASVPVVLSDQLVVKSGKTAIVREDASGDSAELLRLPPGTTVQMIGEAPRYYSLRTDNGQVGWSYKANFDLLSGSTPAPETAPTKASLLARTDLLQIAVIDVEVGDATVIYCPQENGVRDVILIDTGENDSDRIAAELLTRGFVLGQRPITRLFATHYDFDHVGAIREVLPWTQTLYDHGNNNVKSYYLTAVAQPGIDRRTITLNYDETFSGNVRVECVAVNQQTDFDTTSLAPSAPDDNPNSIALIVSFGHFDYFTGGDLTFVGERSLARGIRNCDVYHANHHGSQTTSSDLSFVNKLDPEVTVISNGTRHGHPSTSVAERLIKLGSSVFQTNKNNDPRAYQPAEKFIGDTTVHDDDDLENEEGARGTIRIVVDPTAGKYYVIMPNLPLAEGTFPILDES